VKADPFAQPKLHDVQELDARADLLRHHLATLPELAEIDQLSARRRDLDDQARDARIAVDDLTVEQRKVDADVEQVKTRRERDQQRMDHGLVSNPKDLQRMQQEMESLQRRITSLEDDELEVMERLEEAQQTLDGVTSQLAETDARLAELGAARDRRAADLEQDLGEVAQRRGPVVADVPADLLALYDRLRESKGGVGAALLRARRCEGCNLDIDNAELAQIRSASSDDVIRCEECSRILVRTSESGL
jgi:predicted  nucleic acid-binding Zn-ribbon protein